MVETKEILAVIIEGMQDLKAKKIHKIDLTSCNGPVCDYFLICEGDSNVQVSAIARSIERNTKEKLNDRPLTTIGHENAEWIVLDYMDVIVHVFQRSTREFYDLEHLWEGSKIECIEEI